MRDANSREPDGPAEPASVHVIVEADRTRIVLSGEVDADLAADLREATADAEATGLPIEVDAHHVTFMDSSGIAFLARIATRSAERVRVIRAPETVRFLLDVTRIGELLDVVDPMTDEGGSASPLPGEGPAGRSAADRGRAGRGAAGRRAADETRRPAEGARTGGESGGSPSDEAS